MQMTQQKKTQDQLRTLAGYDGDLFSSDFNFSAPTYSAAENSGTITITVTRSDDTSQAISVDYDAAQGASGTAEDTVNFDITSGTLNFGVGITSRTFDVTLIDDLVFAPAKTVELTLSNPVGGAAEETSFKPAGLGGQATAVLTITDVTTSEPAGSFQFTLSSYSGDEDAGNIQGSVERINGTADSVSVDVKLTNGTALVGTNYTAIGTVTLTWADGDTVDKTFNVPALDDSTPTANLALTATLSNPVNNDDPPNAPGLAAQNTTQFIIINVNVSADTLFGGTIPTVLLSQMSGYGLAASLGVTFDETDSSATVATVLDGPPRRITETQGATEIVDTPPFNVRERAYKITLPAGNGIDADQSVDIGLAQYYEAAQRPLAQGRTYTAQFKTYCNPGFDPSATAGLKWWRWRSDIILDQDTKVTASDIKVELRNHGNFHSSNGRTVEAGIIQTWTVQTKFNGLYGLSNEGAFHKVWVQNEGEADPVLCIDIDSDTVRAKSGVGTDVLVNIAAGSRITNIEFIGAWNGPTPAASTYIIFGDMFITDESILAFPFTGPLPDKLDGGLPQT